MNRLSTIRLALSAGVLLVVAALGFLWLAPQNTLGEEAATDTAYAATTQNSDGTQRQTAHVWTGSPLGPDGSFEDPNREYTLRLNDVFDAMNIKQGSAVADIGAGGGWLSVRLAKRVGAGGTVCAEEILKKYTDFIDKRAQKAGLKNIKTILGTTTDPKLPESTLDAAIILNAYHEFELPLVMLRQIKNALKPGGRLGFIERDTDELRREAREAYAKTGKIKRRVTESRDKDPYTDDHRLAADVIEREAAQVGLKKVQLLELREYHYLLVVGKPK
jgi:ubiquinone/menaquinone biosynthesis C-methylase UbiE